MLKIILRKGSLSFLGMDKIGFDLWMTVGRLAGRVNSLSQEVALRCNEPIPKEPAQAPKGKAAIIKSFTEMSLFSALAARYSAVLSTVTTERAGDVTGMEAALVRFFEDSLRGRNPITVNKEEIIAAVDACCLPLVPGHPPPQAFVASMSAPLAASLTVLLGDSRVTNSAVAAISVAAAVKNAIGVPLLVPRRWWCTDAVARSSVHKLTKVAMVKDPPTIELEFIAVGATGWQRNKRRVIHLEEDISRATPPTELAYLSKKLAQAHGFLFVRSSAANGTPTNAGESILLEHLTTLHHLVKFGRPPPSIALGTSGPSATSPAGAQSQLRGKFSPSAAAPPEPESATGVKADLTMLFRDPEAALRNVDLNSADEITTKEFKAKMDEKFLVNVIKPTDPGYQYDKRVQHQATGQSEWDSD